jgi:restriction system protein
MKSTSSTKIPRYDQLMNPVILALRKLGGSGSIDEIYEKIVEALKLSEDLLTVLHDPESDNRTEVQYQLAWTLTYLKKFGILENSRRGVWALAKKAESFQQVDPKEVKRFFYEEVRKRRKSQPEKTASKETDQEGEESEVTQSWRTALHTVLAKKLSAAAFERLIQRLLRESGFIQVEVTGRSGDGGIDGKGIARIHGFMSFHVVFQCKRWQGVVGSAEIRDFRGAMVGRADKGLFITTGSFSRDALKEAVRDGAPPIDLIDGDQLAEKLKELKLGVATELIENVSVNEDWFKEI